MRIELSGFERLVRALEVDPNTVRRKINIALGESLTAIQVDAIDNHRFISRSGKLESAIEQELNSNDLAGRVSLDARIASYGPLVHQGTRPHDIYPKTRKSLRWPKANGSGFVFSRRVHHPGTAADPFLYNALERQKTVISQQFELAAQEIAKKVVT